MSSRSVLSSGLPATEYYAPDYKIEVNGQEIDPESKGDVLELKVTMDSAQLTNVELTVNNWDDKSLSFKYSDSTIFNPGNSLNVQMGYAGNLFSMADAIITTLAPHFPESGPPTLAVSGQDRLVKLKERKPLDGEQKKFVNQKDSDIARSIALRNGLTLNVQDTNVVNDVVIQKNQDDGLFLKERAACNDYDCFSYIDPDSGQHTVYFGPPTDTRGGSTVRVYVFEWGKSLINFTPVLTLNHQVGKVTVKSWDPTTKSLLQYTAGPDDLPPGSGSDNGPNAVATALADRQDIVVDHVCTCQEEVQIRAQALLRERAYHYLKVSGQVIGLPDLRPGYNVELQGLGKRFSGTYYLLKVEHTLGNSGYLTSFEGRSAFGGGTTK